jgi:hypothetical protein
MTGTTGNGSQVVSPTETVNSLSQALSDYLSSLTATVPNSTAGALNNLTSGSSQSGLSVSSGALANALNQAMLGEQTAIPSSNLAGVTVPNSALQLTTLSAPTGSTGSAF